VLINSINAIKKIKRILIADTLQEVMKTTLRAQKGSFGFLNGIVEKMFGGNHS